MTYKFDLLSQEEQKQVVRCKNFFCSYIGCNGSPSVAEFYENYIDKKATQENLKTIHNFLNN